jgi:transcriptional regulator with XRE-family HTH domain
MGDESIYRAIGRRLRARRRLLGLTQRRVAECCGLTFQQIQKYEAGQVALPVGRLVAIARARAGAPRAFVDDLDPPAQSPAASVTAASSGPLAALTTGQPPGPLTDLGARLNRPR